jgi:hypothetical protein
MNRTKRGKAIEDNSTTGLDAGSYAPARAALDSKVGRPLTDAEWIPAALLAARVTVS